MILNRVFLLPVFLLAFCLFAKADTAILPAFLEDLVKSYEAAPFGSNPESIWSFTYQDQTVYYVSAMYCCDLPSTLYDENGKVLCRPDGGIAGAGDGKCPEFIAERTDGRVLWEDKRSGMSK